MHNNQEPKPQQLDGIQLSIILVVNNSVLDELMKLEAICNDLLKVNFRLQFMFIHSNRLCSEFAGVIKQQDQKQVSKLVQLITTLKQLQSYTGDMLPRDPN